MSVKCVKCKSENTDTAKFCSECAAPLNPIEDISVTKTIETPIDKLSSGTILADRYEIIEELGKGGMGQVYKVHDKEINEKVALKLLKSEIASDESTIERFRNELKIARRVSHKHVCRMHDIGRTDDKYFITMEYVEGEDLKSHIRKKERLSTKNTIGIAKQICEGLVEAHRLGVIHRDLKPQNIMIDKQGEAKIMDFGIARSLEAPGVTATGVIIGTPDYISPEQAGGTEADQRSDIYSLGVILYEMATGDVPFKGDTAFSVALKHKSQLPLHPQKLNPDTSDDLARLILICMEKDRERRYQTAEALLSDLKNIEEGFPLGTKIQPRRNTILGTLIQNKLLIPALVVVIALIAILIWKLLPHEEIISTPKKENSIAIISFQNLTGDPQHDSFMEAVPSLFISKFESMGFSYVVTWEQLQSLLKQIRKDPDQPIDTDTGFAVCQFAGIESLVVGKITKAGNVFAMNINVLDTETQNSLATASAQGQGADSLIVSQIDDLVAQLSERLNLDALHKGAVPAMSDLTTSSMEAYTYYLQGNDAYRMLYYDEAREHYQKAVEIDSTFAMAHLGICLTFAQQNNNNAAKEALQKAIAHLDRVNPKEKLYIQFRHARIIEDDSQKRAQLLEEIVEKYPMELEAHYWIARRLETPNPEEAEKKYIEMLDMDPHYTWALARLIELARRKRDYEIAMEYAKRYITSNPNEPNPYCKLGEIYLDMGQLDLSIEQYGRALEIKPSFRKALDWIGYNFALKEDYSEALKWADEFILRSKAPMEKANGYLTKAFIEYWTGSFQKAQKNAETARIVSKDTQNPLVPYISFLLQGFIHRAQGNYSLARDNFIKAEEMGIKAQPNKDLAYRANKEYFLGSLEIEQGEIEQAQERLSTIRDFSSAGYVKWVANHVERHGQALQGELLIANGSFKEAILLLEPMPIHSITILSIVSLPAGPIMRSNLIQLETKLAHAHEEKGDIDKAIDILEKLIPFDQTESIWRLTPPKIYYNLGRLYEKKGMVEKAQENYSKFLELWKNADPGLPIVEDAKAKLAELTN